MSESNPGRGGPRPGSGRKPKLLTTLLLELPEAAGDVEAAYRLFRDVMNDKRMDTDVRMDAAREVLNRLIGKPRQAVEVTGEGGGSLKVLVEYADAGDPPHPAPTAPGPGDDPAGIETI